MDLSATTPGFVTLADQLEAEKGKVQALRDEIMRADNSAVETLRLERLRHKTSAIMLSEAASAGAHLKRELFDVRSELNVEKERTKEAEDQWRAAECETRVFSEDRTKWIGRTIRLKWLIDEMERAGAIRLPDHEWATDMAKDIEYPDMSYVDGIEVTGSSIFQSISRDTLMRYLPSHEDAHMEPVNEDEEAERIHAWSLEARVLTEGLPQGLLTLHQENPEAAMKKVILIQRHVRGHRARQNVKFLVIADLPDYALAWHCLADQRKVHEIPMTEVWKARNATASKVVIIQRYFRAHIALKIMYFSSKARIIQRYFRENKLPSLRMKNHWIELKAARMIQKVYRGYRTRGIEYYEYTTTPGRQTRRGWDFGENYYGGSEALRHKGTASALTGQGLKATGEKCSLKFLNTGRDAYKVSWVHNDGSDRLCDSAVMSPHSVQSRPTITFPGHWFCIKNLTTGNSKMIRINRFICSSEGQFICRRPGVRFFNVHTGLSGAGVDLLKIVKIVNTSLITYTDKYCAGEYDGDDGIPPDEYELPEETMSERGWNQYDSED